MRVNTVRSPLRNSITPHGFELSDPRHPRFLREGLQQSFMEGHCARRESVEWADFDIAEGDLAVVALEGDAASAGLCEKGHAIEFAFGDALLEVVAAEDVFEVFYGIDVVLAFFGRDDEPYLVPFAGRFRGVEGLAGFGIVRRLI